MKKLLILIVFTTLSSALGNTSVSGELNFKEHTLSFKLPQNVAVSDPQFQTNDEFHYKVLSCLFDDACIVETVKGAGGGFLAPVRKFFEAGKSRNLEAVKKVYTAESRTLLENILKDPDLASRFLSSASDVEAFKPLLAIDSGNQIIVFVRTMHSGKWSDVVVPFLSVKTADGTYALQAGESPKSPVVRNLTAIFAQAGLDGLSIDHK